MKINNNISAVITNKQLLGTEGKLTSSMERLSSGLKINHAADNPSGMAIANKMRAQIRGLDQASRNSSDGSSVMQTVDGALAEVANMLQRMNELAVQAANGTNSYEEKEACQLELNSLRDEIDRVSSTTEFNTKSLLDGSLDARVYVNKENINNISRIQVSDAVPEGVYKFTVTSAATQAEYTTNYMPADLVGTNGTININGSECVITDDMLEEEIKEALRVAAERGECEYSDDGGAIKFTSKAYGAHATIEVIQNSEDFNFTGVPNIAADEEAVAKVMDSGDNPVIDMTTIENFSTHATFTYDGNRVTITDAGGFKMDMLLAADVTETFELEVTEIGIMDLQIGANEGQTMQLRIPSTSAESLYLDMIDLSTANGAKNALDIIGDAIVQISSIRAQAGAYENRLESTTNSLDQTEENMTAALSRIEDVDMAEEMTEYTKYNVLEQAGTSALAQANQIPELALQLLQ